MFCSRAEPRASTARLLSLALALVISTTGCGRVGLELWIVDASVEEPPEDASEPPDAEEAPDSGPSCDSDGDDDGICDANDNCPDKSNSDQADQDGDGLGDSCDPDRDDDGVPNDRDPCPSAPHDDSDGDTICDDVDVCPAGDDRLDTDNDGTPNACDKCPSAAAGDSDHDGVCDDRDRCPGSDDALDADGDQRPDGCDGCPMEPTKSAPDQCACAPNPSRPVAYYPFDESSGSVANDARGMHPGMLVDVSGVPWSPGMFGNALSFDGVDDYVQVGAVTPRLRSLAFWLKVGSFSVTSGETAWRSPTATGEDFNGWSSPQNAYELDRQYAGSGDFSNFARQDWYGFHLAVPSAANIPGIAAEVVFDNDNVTATFNIDLSWNGGMTYTAADTIAPLVYMNERLPFGGPTSNWGHTWTPAQLSDANFRLRLTKDGIPLSPIISGVDHIRVKAYYSSATPIGRRVLGVSPTVRVELSAQQLATVGWPSGTIIYVDGSAVPPSLAGGFHHVVITSPGDLDLSRFQIGGVANEPPFLQGALDDLRVYEETLRPAQVAAMLASPACGQ